MHDDGVDFQGMACVSRARRALPGHGVCFQALLLKVFMYQCLGSIPKGADALLVMVLFLEWRGERASPVRIGQNVPSLDRGTNRVDRWTKRVWMLPGLAASLDPPACQSWQKRHAPVREAKKKQKRINSSMWRGRGSFTFQTGK